MTHPHALHAWTSTFWIHQRVENVSLTFQGVNCVIHHLFVSLVRIVTTWMQGRISVTFAPIIFLVVCIVKAIRFVRSVSRGFICRGIILVGFVRLRCKAAYIATPQVIASNAEVDFTFTQVTTHASNALNQVAISVNKPTPPIV